MRMHPACSRAPSRSRTPVIEPQSPTWAQEAAQQAAQQAVGEQKGEGG